MSTVKKDTGKKRHDTKLKQTGDPSPVEGDTQLNPLILYLSIYCPRVYLVICKVGGEIGFDCEVQYEFKNQDQTWESFSLMHVQVLSFLYIIS